MKQLLLALLIAMPLIAGKTTVSHSNGGLSPQSIKALRAQAREKHFHKKKQRENRLPKNLFGKEIEENRKKKNASTNN